MSALLHAVMGIPLTDHLSVMLWSNFNINSPMWFSPNISRNTLLYGDVKMLCKFEG